MSVKANRVSWKGRTRFKGSNETKEEREREKRNKSFFLSEFEGKLYPQ
jgi:hypothetical protein